MSPLLRSALSLVAIAALLPACTGGDGGGRRTIRIVQTADDCTPHEVTLAAGEKVSFEVKNEGKKDKEIEGIEGTRLEELLVPAGKTRRLNYTAPSRASVQKLKCYVPGGASTIIELRVSGTAGAATGDGDGADSRQSPATASKPDGTVRVDLIEYSVNADRRAVAPGPVKFAVTNLSKTEVHELAVLRVKSDGSFENMGEVEDIEPGASREVVLDLPAGNYLLACLVVPGEAGSKVDHFQQGMRLDFEVR